MNKIKNFLEKHQFVILFALIIAVTGLTILYVGENINENPTDVLISLAAIFSSIFLFLAFKETQRSNRIVICQKIYDEFWNRINNMEARMNLEVFDEKEIQQLSHIRISRNFRYNNFSEYSFNILQIIKDRLVHYEVFSKRFNELLDEIDGQLTNLKNLIDEIEIINYKFYRYFGTILSLKEIHKDIDGSILEKEYKEILLRKLTSISSDYLQFGQKMNDPKSSELIFLKVPKLKSDQNNIWSAEAEDFFAFEFFVSSYKEIDKVYKKYRIRI
jgi:hypothetical protein